MPKLVYPYRPRVLPMLFASLFFAVCGVGLAFEAKSNEQGLIIDGLIRLDPGQATIFYWVLSVTSAVFVVGGLWALVRAFTSRHELVLDDTTFSVPKSGYSDTIVTTRYADVLSMARQQIRNQRFLVIQAKSKVTITSLMLPGREVFEEVCQQLESRVGEARRSGGSVTSGDDLRL